MKKAWHVFKQFFRSLPARKKLRSGAFSLMLTALVILVCVLTGILGDVLEDRFALQIDYSYNGATTQSRVTTEQLQALDKDVHIYVIASAGNLNQSLMSLLTRYAAITPHVTFSQENVAANPLLLSRFQDILGENEVTSDCVVVHCEETDRARVIAEDDFIVQEYDMESGYFISTGLNYDKPLTEAIVFTAQDEPLTLQLLRGHSELSGENLTTMETILTDANYELKEINLLNGDALDVSCPLLILCPQFDLSDKELSLLIEYADAGGDFFIVSNYSDPLDLANYNTLLRTYGISFFQGLVMAQPDDMQSYYDDRPAFLMPRMVETELTLPLIESGKDTLLLPGSRAIRLPETTGVGVTVETLMITGKAYVRDYVAVEPDVTTQQPTDEEGYFSLAVLSTRISDGGNVSKAHIIGNSEMFTHWWVEENTYSADYLLRAIQYLQGASPISLDISGKTGIREPLSITTLTPAVVVIILLPLMVVVAAFKVLLPRKHL